MKKVSGIFFLTCLLSLHLVLPCTLKATPFASGDYQQLIGQAQEIVENEPEKAIGMLHDADKIDPERDPANASEAHALLGDAYYYLDNLDQSLLHYHRAADINKLTGREFINEQITILGNIGYVYDLKEQHLIALDFYRQALSIARKLGNKQEIASNLANIGKVQTLQGYYEDALRNMEEALAIDSESGDEALIATDLNTIGRIYEAWGMFDKAAEYLHQALAINIRLGQEDKVAIRYSGLGLIYKAWGKHEQALEYFEMALAIDKKMKNDDKVALRQANLGSTYLAMGQTDKAIIYIKLGLDYFEKNGMTSYAAGTLIDLGRCYLLKEDFQQAEASFLKSVSLSKPGRLNRIIMNNLQNLSDLYFQTRQFEKAFKAQSEFMLLKDSLFNAESQKKITEFQARFDLDKKQQQIELMKRDQELARKIHVNTRLIFSIVALMLIIGLLTLLVRLKNLQNRRLLAEKENEALRADLEQRNKELTYNAMCIVKNNETMVRMVEAVDSALEAKDDHLQLKNIIHQLQRMENDKSWDDFEVRFIQTHQDFYGKLQVRFPDLTPNERKLCAFLRLNMSTKDIAAITHQSINSINVARTRLRKKLSIDGTDENLIGFLHSL
jgi:tetratricopeptide (TPR) repeat protein